MSLIVPLLVTDVIIAKSPIVLVQDKVLDGVPDGVSDGVLDGVPDGVLDAKTTCNFSL
jgi:hypothetical protein